MRFIKGRFDNTTSNSHCRQHCFASMAGMFLMIIATGCGQKSLVECKVNATDGSEVKDGRCVAKSPDERAMLALNEGDHALAIALLEPLVAAEPTTYFRFPRLAAAYATAAGLDLLNALQGGGGGGSSGGGGGGLDGINQFIPALDPDDRAAYSGLIERMAKAKDLLLEGMPEAERRASAERFYGASADMQLFLYRASYSAMMMKFYVVPVSTDSKELDESVLKELTVDQAVVILDNLRGTVSDAQSSGDNPQAAQSAEKIDEAVTKIEAEEGADLGEKLQNYLRRQQS